MADFPCVSIYVELADQYKVMDAASDVKRRNLLAKHLREVVDVLEQKVRNVLFFEYLFCFLKVLVLRETKSLLCMTCSISRINPYRNPSSRTKLLMRLPLLHGADQAGCVLPPLRIKTLSS